MTKKRTFQMEPQMMGTRVLHDCVKHHSLPHIQRISDYTFEVNDVFMSSMVFVDLRTDLWIINTHHVGDHYAFNFELKLPAIKGFPKE